MDNVIVVASGKGGTGKSTVCICLSVALVKQYEKAVPYFEKRMIKDEWVHNKGIQKARESFRVSNERKAYLIALKLPKSKNRKS